MKLPSASACAGLRFVVSSALPFAPHGDGALKRNDRNKAMFSSGSLGAAVLVLALTSCGAGRSDGGQPVSKSEFEQAGLTWPLTVDSGTIGCTGQAAWFESDGVRYGLNGFASSANGYVDVAPIWAEDKQMNSELSAAGAQSTTPVRVNIGDMIKKALEKCA